MSVAGRRGLAFALLAVLAGAAKLCSQQPPAQESQKIRIGVDRVNVGVIVTDSRGNFVEGLRREDFRVYDNAVEQPISGFLSLEDPAQVLLLVESGPAVRLIGMANIQAADKLLIRLAADDRVALADYSRTAQLLLDFSADKSLARTALRTLNFTNGFADLSLSSSLSPVIDWLASVPGKKTIVVLSSGIDTSPVLEWLAVLQKLNVSDVRILAVSLSQNLRKPAKGQKSSNLEKEDRDLLKQGFAQADKSLRQISAASGGRAYFPSTAKDFERTYAEIAELVRHEYSLAFAPQAPDGRVHSIEVKVRHSGYRVDHRQAYLAPPPSPN